MSLKESFYYSFDVWWKPKGAEEISAYKQIPQEGRLVCYSDNGLIKVNEKFNMFKIPKDVILLILDILEPDIQNGNIVKSVHI